MAVPGSVHLALRNRFGFLCGVRFIRHDGHTALDSPERTDAV